MKYLTHLLSTLCLLCTASAVAQDTVTLTFSNPMEQESRAVQSMATLQHIHTLENAITGPISGLQYTLNIVQSIDGKEERRPLGSYTCPSDTLRFHFATQPVGTDSVQVIIPQPIGLECKLAITNADQCILMETYPEDGLTTADVIPVIAFSPGKTLEFQLPDGQVVRGMHYCSVRDGHLNPFKWHEEFGLQDYIWFELKFTDNTPR